MASFDVTSLFTNIPLDGKPHGFSRAEFIKLLNLAVKNCRFIFNGNFYD